MSFNLYQKLMDEFTSDQQHFIDPEGLVDHVRIAKRLDALSQIGLNSENGSDRHAFSKADRAAKELAKQWMQEAGLTVREDAFSNVIGRLEGSDPTLGVCCTGGHLDTVPNGGHFDGTIGVVCALEVAHALQENSVKPKRGFEVIVFSDEEGARFGSGLSGSRAIAGSLSLEKCKSLTDHDGITMEEAMRADGKILDDLREAVRDSSEIDSYVEIHIEQGSVLENAQLPVGIVSGIAGPCWMQYTFTGKAEHAGATPMDQRKDAMVAAAHLITFIEEQPRKINNTGVATVGKISVHPGGANVIPEQVVMVNDIRDIDASAREQLIRRIVSRAEEIAKERGILLNVQKMLDVPPVMVDKRIRETIEEKVTQCGIKPMNLMSGAGHDAMIVAEVAPMGMIFVRSKDGVSHNPVEWSSLSDITCGAAVLTRTIFSLLEK